MGDPSLGSAVEVEPGGGASQPDSGRHAVPRSDRRFDSGRRQVQPRCGSAVGPPLEPGTRSVPGRGDHEAGPVRVLPRDRAGARPSPAQPAVHDEALALRRGRGGVLPEAGAEGDAGLDPDADVPHLPARGRAADGRLPTRQHAGGGALDGAVELHRHERLVLARRQAAPPGLRALRPRSARRRVRTRGPRRPPDPRGASSGSSSTPTSRRAGPTGSTFSSRSPAERPTTRPTRSQSAWPAGSRSGTRGSSRRNG